ncbi:hypothetical protein P0L94_07885 [Microbacter sp. GSS18]|nr:hypothetical protein P0L94_07885 [Microbacter sp. GSS18]
MSNRRRGGLKPLYRDGFLASPAWHARRARWFRDHARTHTPLECAGCGHRATPDRLELHHLSYAGVTVQAGEFKAFEKHTDLLPLHPYCHEALHRMIDRDEVLARHRTRRDATHQALQRLRPRLHAAIAPAEGAAP